MFPMRKQRDRSRLRFRTVGQQKSQRNRKAVLIFLAVLLLVAAASGFVVWRELSQREPEMRRGKYMLSVRRPAALTGWI